MWTIVLNVTLAFFILSYAIAVIQVMAEELSLHLDMKGEELTKKSLNKVILNWAVSFQISVWRSFFGSWFNSRFAESPKLFLTFGLGIFTTLVGLVVSPFLCIWMYRYAYIKYCKS